MTDRVEKHGLQVAAELAAFIEEKALPGTGVKPTQFWKGFSGLVADLGPDEPRAAGKARRPAGKDRRLASRAHGRSRLIRTAYQAFLRRSAIWCPEGADFEIETTNVDPEIATVPGPQLVVPITNARYALNAANARWGSLYDALYGTDALGELPPEGGL